jgi:hypothetical protein
LNSFLVKTAGFPLVKLSVLGSLPTGISFSDNGNGTGTLSGIPQAPAADTAAACVFHLTFVATSGLSVITQPFTLTLEQPPAITSVASATLSSVTKTFTVTAVGFPIPALTQIGAPLGVTLTDNKNGTATLTSTKKGTFTFMIAASAPGLPKSYQVFTLTVV